MVSQSKRSPRARESLVRCDSRGRITFWSRTAEQLYGWPESEVLGQDIDALLQTEVARELNVSDRSTIRSTEVWRTTSSGNRLVVELCSTARHDDLGQAIPFSEASRAVTARRGNATFTSGSDESFRKKLLDEMPTSMWVIDLSGARLMVEAILASGVANARQWFAERPDDVRALMRRTHAIDINARSAELFGPSSKLDLMQSVEPYWPEGCDEDYLDLLFDAIDDVPNLTKETRQRKIDGGSFDALLVGRVDRERLAEDVILFNVFDTTELNQERTSRKQTESFYRHLFDYSPLAVFELDYSANLPIYDALKSQNITDFIKYGKTNPEFLTNVMRGSVITDVNETTVRLFGASSRQQLIGSPVAPFWIPGRSDALLNAVASFLNGESTFRQETQMRTLDGREIDVLFTSASSGDLRAAAKRIVGILDISDRVAAQNAVIELQDKFAHAARVSSLGELVASISHEVNQPLSAIATNSAVGLRMLANPAPDLQELRVIFDEVVADAQRASEIISRIRAMALPQSRPYLMLRVNDLIQEAMLFLNPQLARLSVQHRSNLEAGLPDVLGDKVQLQQVIVNLVLNSIQAMEQCSTREISIRTSQLDQGQLAVIIDDTGPGIPAHHQARLFESFFTTKAQGMGIGLSICRSIMEAHGGTVSIESLFGGGARAIIQLPVPSL